MSKLLRGDTERRGSGHNFIEDVRWNLTCNGFQIPVAHNFRRDIRIKQQTEHDAKYGRYNVRGRIEERKKNWLFPYSHPTNFLECTRAGIH